jgi:lipoyl synthase
LTCRRTGLDFVPHVVVGLHFGKILGEYRALEMIREAGPKSISMVVMTPTVGTGMGDMNPPSLKEIEEVLGYARRENPLIFLNLGCARPPGMYKRQVERIAIECGFNGIAFPSEEAIECAMHKGLTPVFTEVCCSLAFRASERFEGQDGLDRSQSFLKRRIT